MIDLETNNGIAIVTVRHGKANALDVELCEELAHCLEELRSSEARGVVLTGQGRMFSAGVNLLRLISGGSDYVRKFLPTLHRLYDVAFFYPKPMVAAINGHAIAGGCLLACCADKRIMARAGGRIGTTEVLVGVPFPALAFEIVRFAVSSRDLAEFTFGSATFETDVALRRGWVDEVVEADALLPRAIAAAQELAQLSPMAFRQNKEQVRAPVAERMERSGAATEKAVTDIWANPETLRYVREYVARVLKKAELAVG